MKKAPGEKNPRELIFCWGRAERKRTTGAVEAGRLRVALFVVKHVVKHVVKNFRAFRFGRLWRIEAAFGAKKHKNKAENVRFRLYLV